METISETFHPLSLSLSLLMGLKVSRASAQPIYLKIDRLKTKLRSCMYVCANASSHSETILLIITA
jgi:hypothetical protein